MQYFEMFSATIIAMILVPIGLGIAAGTIYLYALGIIWAAEWVLGWMGQLS